MTRILTAAAGIATLLSVAACGGDTLFNDKPPPPGTVSSSGNGQSSTDARTASTQAARPTPTTQTPRRIDKVTVD
jgi:hypothetical protein